MKRIKSIILFLLIFLLHPGFGQSYGEVEFDSGLRFEMGSPIYPEICKVTFKVDEIFAKTIANYFKDYSQYSIQYPLYFSLNYQYSGIHQCWNRTNDIVELDSIMSKTGYLMTKNGVQIDLNFLDEKLRNKVAFIIGNPNLSKNERNKIKYLFYDFTVGNEIDFSTFKNVKTIISQDVRHFVGSLKLTDSKMGESKNLGGLFYPGNLNFYDSFDKCKELETVVFDNSIRMGGPYLFDNIYGLSFPDAEFFKLPKLKHVDFNYLSMLPVDFKSFEKLDYLSCTGLCGPELINLALVMYSFDKDSGSWYRYLTEADLNKKINIPENGIYTSYYKNGQKLCEGSFLNGKPNGAWSFWYNDGEICQERFYKNGERDGHWSFYRVNGSNRHQWNKPIAFIFENGKLLNYTIQSFDHIGYSLTSCKSLSHEQLVSKVENYNIDWTTDSTMKIKKIEANIALEDNEWFKIVRGDTLKENIELWEFNETRWKYLYQEFCLPEGTTYKKKAEGYLNKFSDYWSESYLSKKDELIWTTDEIVDLRTCKRSINRYSNDNLEKELRLIESKIQEITPEIWTCKR